MVSTSGKTICLSLIYNRVSINLSSGNCLSAFTPNQALHQSAKGCATACGSVNEMVHSCDNECQFISQWLLRVYSLVAGLYRSGQMVTWLAMLPQHDIRVISPKDHSVFNFSQWVTNAIRTSTYYPLENECRSCIFGSACWFSVNAA